MEEALKYHMRLRLYRTERNFGPGVATLMTLVEKQGSLSAACKEMHMSYSKAWKIVKAAETDLGFALMEGSSGGESGGRTVLTTAGSAFLHRYLEFETEVQKQVEQLFQKYYNQ
ncbi:MAG: LysR family transcriptional regulator [Hungatella sp.]